MIASATESQTPTLSSTFDAIPELTAADRCDATTSTIREGSGSATPRVACGAQAYVTALFPSGHTLQFCAHHGREHEASLGERGAVLRDQSAVLRPSAPGATA